MDIQTPKVLVIDDDIQTIHVLNTALQSFSNVYFSTDSSQALAMAHEIEPALILLDVEMPGLNGWQVCRQLRATPQTANIPVIFMTGHDSVEDQLRCFEAGASDFVQKPFDLAVIRARAGVHLELRKKSMEAERERRRVLEEKERLRVMLHSIGDAVITTDIAGLVTYMNPVAETMTGFREYEALGRPIESVMPLRTGATGIQQINPVRLALSERRIVGMALDAQMLTRRGVWIDVEDSAAPLITAKDTADGAVIVFHDVSEARAMAAKMTHLSHYDQLTNLPNRLLLLERMKHALDQAKRFGNRVGLLVINIDAFKVINDLHSHAVGDAVLLHVARQLEAALTSGGTLSRGAGDEFFVLVPDALSAEELGNLASALLQAGSKPVDHFGVQHVCSVSIGIGVYPDDAKEQETLLRHAESAKYRAKADGRNCYRFFSHEVEKSLRQRYALESTIKKAIDGDLMEVLYQPKIDGLSGRLDSVEALVRLRGDDEELITPASFIPLAEETRLIVPLGLAVFRKACVQARLWRDAGHPLKVGVNVSPIQFLRADFWASFLEILDETGASPADLEIEITEGLLLENSDFVLSSLSLIREAGLTVAMDDFGTGYSSLAYLKSLPLDVLKIDGVFVRNMLRSDQDMALIDAIIALARNFNLRVVAESVETEVQVNALLARGCRIMQGYFYSKPVGAREIDAYF